MPDEQSETLELTDNDFDLAFEAAAADPVPPEPEALTPEVPAEPVVPEVVEPPPEPEVPKPEVVEPPPEPGTPEVPKPEPPKVDPAAEAAAKAAQDAADKAAADAKTAAEAEAKRVAEEAAAKEAYTDEEQAAIAEVATNFPEVNKALEAVQRVAFTKAENAFNQKLAALTQQFEQRLAPIASVATTVARSAHEAAILKAHSDAFEIADKVRAWVATQPAVLQPAYNEVLSKGTAGQVIEVLDFYKKAVTPADPAAVTPAAPVKDLEKEKKLQSQEGVRGRQTSQKSGIDEDDFESAFNAAAKN